MKLPLAHGRYYTSGLFGSSPSPPAPTPSPPPFPPTRSDLGIGFPICDQCLLESPFLSGAPDLTQSHHVLSLRIGGCPQEHCLDRCFQNPTDIFMILIMVFAQTKSSVAFPHLPQRVSAAPLPAGPKAKSIQGTMGSPWVGFPLWWPRVGKGRGLPGFQSITLSRYFSSLSTGFLSRDFVFLQGSPARC